jgi:hypothetical protein
MNFLIALGFGCIAALLILRFLYLVVKIAKPEALKEKICPASVSTAREKRKSAEKCLACLYVAVESNIADDVLLHVRAAFDEYEALIAMRLQPEPRENSREEEIWDCFVGCLDVKPAITHIAAVIGATYAIPIAPPCGFIEDLCGGVRVPADQEQRGKGVMNKHEILQSLMRRLHEGHEDPKEVLFDLLLELDNDFKELKKEEANEK